MSDWSDWSAAQRRGARLVYGGEWLGIEGSWLWSGTERLERRAVGQLGRELGMGTAGLVGGRLLGGYGFEFDERERGERMRQRRTGLWSGGGGFDDGKEER
ncbi:hypothetical protein ACFE04_013818 [Oxalis oulophora]